MALVTLKGHISRALDFYNKDSIYFKVGRTTPWTQADISPEQPSTDVVDDNHPPLPTPTSEITDVVGYKKVESKFMVIEDDTNGTITYRDTKWRIVDPTQAILEGSHWVYVSTVIAYEELPIDISYRQIGVNTGLIPKATVPQGKYNLLPSEVDNDGIMEIINNRKPINRASDLKETLSMVIEF